MLTIMQRHLLELVSDFAALRQSQLVRYAYLKFGASTKRITAELRQLHMLGKVRIENEIIKHPEKRGDNDAIDAFDIMLSLCQVEPEVAAGNGIYKLLFFMQENGGTLQAYKVVIVHDGEEEILSAKLESDIYPKNHVILFLVNNLSQAGRLYTSRPCYFLVKEDSGNFSFYEGNSK